MGQSRRAAADRWPTRASSCGNIASGYILVKSEAPIHYPTTFRIIIGVMCATIGLACLLAALMAMENRRRDRADAGAEDKAGDLTEASDWTDGVNLRFRYLC